MVDLRGKQKSVIVAAFLEVKKLPSSTVVQQGTFFVKL